MDMVFAFWGRLSFMYCAITSCAVNVETGEVTLSGSAQYPAPITNPEAGLAYLTQSAIARALCPIEGGYEWVESSRFETGRCRKVQ